jgi:periodic tryptophan protein 1
MSSMITTAAWVPRGFAAPFPSKYTFDEDEFERIAELAKLQLDDAKEDLEEAEAEAAEDGEPEVTAEKSKKKEKKSKKKKDAEAEEEDIELAASYPTCRRSIC